MRLVDRLKTSTSLHNHQSVQQDPPNDSPGRNSGSATRLAALLIVEQSSSELTVAAPGVER